MKIYPLTHEVIDNFLPNLYTSSTAVQMNEQERIANRLQNCLPDHFRSGIAYAINEQIPMVRDKQTDAQPTAQHQGNLVQVTPYEARQKRQDSAEEQPPNPKRANLRQSTATIQMLRMFYKTP